MKIKSATYFLDGQAAVDAAMGKAAAGEVFYYDGPDMGVAPKNCINVPIDRFYSYFQAGFNPLPVKLDFSNKDFSEAVQTAIARSIEDAIISLRQEILGLIDPAAVSEETLDGVLVHSLVLLLSVNNGLNQEDSALIEKLLALSLSVYEKNGFELQDGTRGLLNDYLQDHGEDSLVNNIKVLSVWYALNLILNTERKAELDKKYFELLAKSNDLMDIYHNYQLIAQAFPAKYFDSYVENYSKALFLDGFIDKPIRQQKEAVCKLVYFTIMFYERNKSFIKIYEALYGVYLQAISHDLAELILWLYSPLLYCHNSVLISQEDFAKFNEHVDKPLTNYLKDQLSYRLQLQSCRTKPAVNAGRTKVGFLVERVLDYSLTNVLCALLNNLAAENIPGYEFVVYDLNFKELGGSNAEAVAKLCATGFTYIDLHQEIVGSNEHFYSILDKVVKVREKIIHDNIDVLIATNGRPEVNFLFANRTAPVQVFWTHGNYVFDCDGIDKRIVHYVSDDYKPYGYEFLPFEIAVNYDLSKPQEYKEKAWLIRDKWPKGTIVLGSIGRLSKLDNHDYLNVVGKLLKENANAVYMACGSGEKSEIEAKIEPLGIAGRFYFEGYIDPKVYAFVIDIYLDPFPFGGGESLQEFKARTANGLVVSYNELVPEDLNHGINIYYFKSAVNINFFDWQYNSKKHLIAKQYNKSVICSDPPSNKAEADFIVAFVSNIPDSVYILPSCSHEYCQFFPDDFIRNFTEVAGSNSYGDYVLVSDLYLVFYNYLFEDLFLRKNNVFFFRVDMSSARVPMSEKWNVGSDTLHAGVIAEITGCSKNVFDSESGRFEAFRLFYQKAGIESAATEDVWTKPRSGIEISALLCQFALQNKTFAALLSNVDRLYCEKQANCINSPIPGNSFLNTIEPDSQSLGSAEKPSKVL